MEVLNYPSLTLLRKCLIKYVLWNTQAQIIYKLRLENRFYTKSVMV